MRGLIRFIRRNGCFLPLLILMITVIGGLTYIAGTLGIRRPPTYTVPTQIATAAPPLLGTPIARFFQLDPAIIDYLDNRQPSYGIVPLDALGLNVQPVGAYLPIAGNTQFSLAAPTPLPTPLPYPTSPPLPLPFVPDTILRTLVPPTNVAGAPRTLPYEVPQNVDCAPSGNPVDGLLTQRFHIGHPGIDLALPIGSPVKATQSAQVIFAGWSEIGYGYLIILQSGPFITYYAHNTSFNVVVGDFVGKGSIVSWSGSTGNSSGPHVHYETRINDVPVDPQTFENRGYASC